MDIKSLSCAQKTRAALASLWAPAGALVIDEAPQGAAALYHALALRSTYGRAAAHRLDIAEYAEPATTSEPCQLSLSAETSSSCPQSRPPRASLRT